MTTFLTVDQLAQRLHRSPRTIQRWTTQRRIPHVKLGRATLFTEDQVSEIAAAYTVEPRDPVIEHELPNPAYLPNGPVVVPMRRPGGEAA
jgi:excisionase family DNA binding protein